MTCHHGPPNFMSQCPYCLQDTIDELQIEIAQLRPDANRYRWLRDEVSSIRSEVITWIPNASGDKIDSFIDEERSELEKD